ncbi:Acyl-coenzyme A:6-aminopenicillanic acid acyl-transferase [Enhygromyxa salina]|uniref:Acyl-coenzyme A:6-aminopenicillanic acid acyl-transferase n=1 Tax=Enhygromyxa salina TaxID=215803 RepID=A0A2S9XJN2_9BACT|nr:C45 family peptidase [Enhygromyxa salina]PRP93075.1 Acyl-coenzyme A:6-aminopenicillanic acid acyl-transferase [Enhygromyxa salina]
MRVLSFSGTLAAIGEAFGEECRADIPQLYAARLRNAIAQAELHGGRDVGEEAVLDVARQCIEPTRAHHPDGFAELEGIARGAGLAVEKILAMNGLTDIRDVLAWGGELEALGGCTSFVVAGDRTRSGKLLCGQTWDLATDNMPHVRAVHRRPDQGPQTWTLTTVGCLSLIGLNEAGIAIGTTNIRTTDARPGVTYLSLIHKALAATTLDQAAAAIRSAPRAGAHFFYLADGQGHGLALECTPTHVDTVAVDRGVHVHTNHCLVPEHAAIEGKTPSASSHDRYDRLMALIEGEAGGAALDSAKRWFGDRENGDNAIARVDFNGISSNGAVVMEPESGTIHACHGPAHEATWVDLRASSPTTPA